MANYLRSLVFTALLDTEYPGFRDMDVKEVAVLITAVVQAYEREQPPPKNIYEFVQEWSQDRRNGDTR